MENIMNLNKIGTSEYFLLVLDFSNWNIHIDYTMQAIQNVQMKIL